MYQRFGYDRVQGQPGHSVGAEDRARGRRDLRDLMLGRADVHALLQDMFPSQRQHGAGNVSQEERIVPGAQHPGGLRLVITTQLTQRYR